MNGLRRQACVFFYVEEMEEMLNLLSNDNQTLRPKLQEAGRNAFGWR